MTRTSPTAPEEFYGAYAAIQQATDPVVLFGGYDSPTTDNPTTGSPTTTTGGSWRHQPGDLQQGDQEAALRLASRNYHRLARLVHPDLAPVQQAAEAQVAFARLGLLWEQYQREQRGCDRSGRRRGRAEATVRTTVRAGRRTYTIGAEFCHGDLADLHRASYLSRDGRDVNVVLKMSRSPATNDAMDRESLALRHLSAKKDGTRAAFVPRLVDSFRHSPQPADLVTGTTGHGERTAIVLEPVAGFHSLARVAATYPDGVDGLDLAWMWRRLLVALGYAHRAGVVHGAVVPKHVLVRPRDQSLVLVEWGYSVVARRRWHRSATVPGPAPATDRFIEFYPPGGPAERGPTEAADVHMATRCMTTLFRDDTPIPLLRFAQTCLLPASARRPNIWQLVETFDEIVDQLYGPRRDRPFHRSSLRFDE